jgi:hypothetical protein
MVHLTKAGLKKHHVPFGLDFTFENQFLRYLLEVRNSNLAGWDLSC